jgi:hypothetical protein
MLLGQSLHARVFEKVKAAIFRAAQESGNAVAVRHFRHQTEKC